MPGIGLLASALVLVAGNSAAYQHKQSEDTERRLRRENAEQEKALLKKTLQADF
jgi:hypothetical protein